MKKKYGIQKLPIVAMMSPIVHMRRVFWGKSKLSVFGTDARTSGYRESPKIGMHSSSSSSPSVSVAMK